MDRVFDLQKENEKYSIRINVIQGFYGKVKKKTIYLIC